MNLETAVDWCKRVWLRRAVGYSDSQRYWNTRWGLNLTPAKSDYSDVARLVRGIMRQHGCESVLEVGCGRYPLAGLPGYIGMDFSKVALDQSGLDEYVVGDITRRIPLPDKSVDALYSGNVLLHIPPSKIGAAVKEYQRVARKVVILAEPVTPYESRFNCYYHDLGPMFDDFPGEVIFTEKGGKA